MMRMKTLLQPPLLIYDGDCGFCERSARWLARLDRRQRVRVCAWQSPSVLELSGLTAQECQEAAWFVDAAGQRYRGADAIVAALREIGTPWCWFAQAYRLALVRAMARRIYGWVARNRHRLPGGTPRCAAASARTHQP